MKEADGGRRREGTQVDWWRRVSGDIRSTPREDEAAPYSTDPQCAAQSSVSSSSLEYCSLLS
jgi:hypothetical protein